MTCKSFKAIRRKELQTDDNAGGIAVYIEPPSKLVCAHPSLSVRLSVNGVTLKSFVTSLNVGSGNGAHFLEFWIAGNDQPEGHASPIF